MRWTWLFMGRMISTLRSVYRFSIYMFTVSYKRDRLIKRDLSDYDAEKLSPVGKMALSDLRKPHSQRLGVYRVLSENGILKTVIQNLHFQDFVMLTHTSRYFQHLLLGPPSLSKETIRITTCTPHSKSRCWACNTQICIVSPFSVSTIPYYHCRNPSPVTQEIPLLLPELH